MITEMLPAVDLAAAKPANARPARRGRTRIVKCEGWEEEERRREASCERVDGMYCRLESQREVSDPDIGNSGKAQGAGIQGQT